jgi:hypothetical protein
LESRAAQLEDELAALKQQLRRESDRLAQEAESSREQLAGRDFVICNQQVEMDSLAHRVSELLSDKAKSEHKLEEERNRSKRLESELQLEQRSSKEKLRRQQ